MYKFLKASIFFFTLNSVLFLNSYAQSIDYNTINNEALQAAQDIQNNEPRFNTNVLIALGIRDLFSNNFPKRTKMRGVGADHKKLMRCLRRVSDRQLGGIYGPEYISEILKMAMIDNSISEDSFVISDSVDECKRGLRKLKKIKISKKSFTVLSNKIDSLNVSSKVKDFIKDFYYSKNYTCELIQAKVAAGLLLGVAIGTQYVRCLTTSGKVTHYAGLNGGVVGMFGAKVSIGKSTKDNNIQFDKKSGFFNSYSYEESYAIRGEDTYVVGPATLGDDKFEVGGSNIGLASHIFEKVGGVGFKIWPRGNRWQYLVDKLK